VLYDDICRYPAPHELEQALEQECDAAPGGVLCTAGADEALDRVCRGYLAPGRHAVLVTPTFEMLPRYAALAGAEVTEVAWPAGDLPLAALDAAVRPETTLIGVVSPNNPTGAVAALADLQALAEANPKALLVVDQAYGEFADVDLTRPLARVANVVSVRTFSKARGLAGLRVGWAVGAPAVIEVLRAAGGPYAVSRPSLAMATVRLRQRDDVADYVARVRTERAELTARLTRRGVEVLPSQANFVLCRLPDAEAFDAALATAGIAVRAFPGRAALTGWRRITCPADAGEFERLLAACDAALGGA